MSTKIENVNTEVEVDPTVVDLDSIDSVESTEETGRDYVKDGLAIGAGLLALDGLYHVGKFVYVKAAKPLFGKIKSGFSKMKENRKARQMAKDQPVVEVIDKKAEEKSE